MTQQELAELDLAVAQAEGFYMCWITTERGFPECAVQGHGIAEPYSPSKNRSEAMWLVEKHKFCITYFEKQDGSHWAVIEDNTFPLRVLAKHTTLTIAICLACIEIAKKNSFKS